MKTVLLKLQMEDETVIFDTLETIKIGLIDFKVLDIIREPYSVQSNDGVIHTGYEIITNDPEETIIIGGDKYPISKEMVDHPTHYNDYSVETIDMMVKLYGASKVADWCEITAFKYRMRAGKKHSLKEDIKKEVWYLNKAEELRDANVPK